MRPVETIQEWGEEGKRRMVEGVNSTLIYLIYYKTFCKNHNVPPPSTTLTQAMAETT
jgi:hypothetical protein